MVVALNDGDGAPYAFPVNFVLLGDALYIHTAFTGKKMDLIRKNPRVGFSAYADVRIIREKATTTFRSVCGTGTAIIVEDKEEKRTALDAITVRYKSLCPRPAPDSMINRSPSSASTSTRSWGNTPLAKRKRSKHEPFASASDLAPRHGAPAGPSLDRGGSAPLSAV